MDAAADQAIDTALAQLAKLQEGLAPIDRFCDLMSAALLAIREGVIPDRDMMDQMSTSVDIARSIRFSEITATLAFAIDTAMAHGGFYDGDDQ